MPFESCDARAQKELGLQRLFSAFPDGWPGLGLLLIRIAVGGTAAVQGGVHLANVSSATPVTALVGVLTILGGGAVLAGLLTPGSAIAMSFGVMLFWIPSPVEGLFLGRIAAVLIVTDAIALAFLGPGAYSIDGVLFGRREILIPRDSHSSKS